MRYAIPVIVIPYMFWVRMMPKFRLAKEKEKQEDTVKRPQQKVYFFFQQKLDFSFAFVFALYILFALRMMSRWRWNVGY